MESVSPQGKQPQSVLDRAIKRIIEYSKLTGISVKSVERWNHFQDLNVPDLRGFCPHLRCVNLYSGQKWTFKSDKKVRDLSFLDKWVLHDLCHILFYDYATLSLGSSLWSEPERFYECHLASEAFAVLLLDYNLLIPSGAEGLAVDMSIKAWQKLSKKQVQWPQLQSREFSDWVTQNYLTGELGWVQRVEPEISDEPNFQKWLGHELRYGSKQRAYVGWWWDDLNNSKLRRRSVSVEGSKVEIAVWDLLSLVIEGSDKTWKSWVKTVSGEFSNSGTNLFGNSLKFVARPKNVDYRFTDLTSQKKGDALRQLNLFKRASSSGLFMIYQILAQDKKAPTAKMRGTIKKVVNGASRNSIKKADWDELLEYALISLNNFNWEPQPDRLATFFLP